MFSAKVPSAVATYRAALRDKALRVALEVKVHLAVHGLMRGMTDDQVSAFLALTKAKNLVLFLIRYKSAAAYLMTGEMLSKVHHSFGGHLHGIKLWLSGLAEEVDANHDLDSLRSVVTQGIDAMDKLFDQAWGVYASIKLAHQAMGELSLSKGVDLNSIIERSAKLKDSLDESRKVELELSLDPELCRCCLAKSMIEHVINNLLINAFQATTGRAQRRVWVTTRNIAYQSGAGVEIQIKDNGSGFTPQVACKMFDPFFTTKGVRGTGLGLPVSRDLVERHGGTLDIVNNLVEPGATVTVRLPVEAKVSI
jgi:signal transduction histidine kinase